MKTPILSIILFFIVLVGYCQKGTAVYYEHQTRISKNDLKSIPQMLRDEMAKDVNSHKSQSVLNLQGNTNLYHFKGTDFTKKDDNLKNIKNETNGATIVGSSIEVNSKELKFIKNIKKNNYLTKVNGKLVSTPLPKAIWKFTNKIKKIAGYNCYEATTTFKKHKLTAFFTKELNIKGSPDTLPFLDGVILEYSYSRFYVKAVKVDLNVPIITNFL